MKWLKYASILFLCLVCFSCASKQKGPVSFVDIENEPELINTIAVEIVDLISQEKNINTTINLVYEFGDVLGDKIFEELKTRGFPLSESDGLHTSFVVNSLDGSRIYLSITMGKMMLSRIFIYEVQTGSLKPGSPLNIGEV